MFFAREAVVEFQTANLQSDLLNNPNVAKSTLQVWSKNELLALVSVVSKVIVV